jgi:DnaJ-class molecular chaperone
MQMQADPSSADFYKRLGVAPDATPEGIRMAFVAMEKGKEVHPDGKPPPLQDHFTHMLQNVNEAYQTLKDPRARKKYDAMRGGASTQSRQQRDTRQEEQEEARRRADQERRAHEARERQQRDTRQEESRRQEDEYQAEEERQGENRRAAHARQRETAQTEPSRRSTSVWNTFADLVFLK